MKLYSYCFTLAFLLLTCLYGCKRAGHENVSGNPAMVRPIALPDTFYKKLTGYIGSIPVSLDLIRKDSMLTGSYYYNKVGINLSLVGKIMKDGSINLTEKSTNDEVTGYLKGTFTSDSTFSGTWEDPQQQKTLSLTLTERKGDYAGIEFISYHTEDCKAADAFRMHPENIESWFDTLCATLDVEVIQVKTENAVITQKINKAIADLMPSGNFSEEEASRVEDSLPQVEPNTQTTVSCGVITNDHHVLCIAVSTGTYNFGAAHPNHSGNLYNFDLQTGNLLALEDLLLPGYQALLTKKAEAYFVKANGSEGWNFEPGKFYLSADFAITSAGLLFMYDPYEIGPYAAGDPEVLIPYKDIKELIKPDSPVAIWLK